MNTCKKCNAKTIEVLISKTGYSCKKCVSEYNRNYRAANKQRIAALKKAWVENHKDYKAAQDKIYALANPEARKAAKNKWKKANPELNRLAKSKYEKNNIEKIKAAKKLWQNNNSAKRQAICIKRRAAKINRTPKWLTDIDYQRIENEYRLAALQTKLTGEPWHVDHIIPLQGKMVSGLHVPNNLKAIPAKDNMVKSNKFEVNNAI